MVPHRIDPELCGLIITFNMNMARLIPITSVEKTGMGLFSILWALSPTTLLDYH